MMTDKNWHNVAKLALTSRAIDEIEEKVLTPQGKVLYQFSARGHDVNQVILGQYIDHPHDGVSGYYRSRPLMLTLGVSIQDALASGMGRIGGYNDGRDVGVVCSYKKEGRPTVLPMAGDVGSQFTPITGWGQSIEYYINIGKKEYKNAIAVACGGDSSVATSGFWAALTIATTLKLPILFYIEDNKYGISVPAHFQTPGGNIADNLASFKNLMIYDTEGKNLIDTNTITKQAIEYVRYKRMPALLRVIVPRLSGHSFQDNQSYRPTKELNQDRKDDPLIELQKILKQYKYTTKQWNELKESIQKTVEQEAKNAWNRPSPDILSIKDHVYAIENTTNHPEPAPISKKRITFVEAIRKTLDHALDTKPNVVIFGEDVGKKGGVHAVTLNLQSKYGEHRVFDTSLSEEGIIGRAIGMALNQLKPITEIQFRKYADPATEQLNNCGTIRWRTVAKFDAPIVVRMPVGFFKCGDPWHSQCNEVFFAHAIGWQVLFPSNVVDAVGLLRSAILSKNPCVFLEHRYLLDAKYSRGYYPGDNYTIPIGKGRKICSGNQLTIVTWGAMCERCELAILDSPYRIEIIDIRCIKPWDKDIVYESVKKTNRCLVVHEDTWTAGFGAEIIASISQDLFTSLDAPPKRLAVPDIPLPYNTQLMDYCLPSVQDIKEAINHVMSF